MRAVALAARQLLRLAFLGALALGIAVWTGHGEGLLLLHMGLGFLLVLSLLALAVAGAGAGASSALVAAAAAVAVAVPVLGLTQAGLAPGPGHWLVQVVHLLLGLAAVSLGERLGAQTQRTGQVG